MKESLAAEATTLDAYLRPKDLVEDRSVRSKSMPDR